MSPERNKVAVITDSGSSMRPEYRDVQELGVIIVPLNLSFYEKDKYLSYNDLDISPSEFYQRMRDSNELPQTSGAVSGRISELFRALPPETDSAISINITSQHSAVWSSAVTGAKIAQEERPKALNIEVVDSKQISLGTWFLAQQAALSSQRGVSLEEIKAEVLTMIPQIELRVVLQTLGNLKRGGRADDIVKAYLASALHINPILGLNDGKLIQLEKTRSPKKSRERMIEMVGDSGPLVRLGVIHTNAPKLAEEVKTSLKSIYPGEIPVFEAGPVLGVHAGEDAVGISFQKRA